jgi:hypothetical protein
MYSNGLAFLAMGHQSAYNAAQHKEYLIMKNPMKYSILGLLGPLCLLAAQQALADSPCGQATGTYTDTDTTGFVSRTISRFEKGSTIIYSYSITVGTFLTPGVTPFDGEESTLKILMDGKSAITHSHMSCTSAETEEVLDGICLDPAYSAPGVVSPKLFTYAANGDHLNVWEGEITIQDMKGQFVEPTPFRFGEKKFSEMKFQ